MSNIWRQRCDALQQICIHIQKHSIHDVVVIDLSTLRVQDDTLYRKLIFENILQRDKYSDVLLQVDDSSFSRTSPMNIVSSMVWSKITTRPIWDIPERLIEISCDDRDVAKSLAADVLKESSNVSNFEVLNLSVVDVEEEKEKDEHTTTMTMETNVDIVNTTAPEGVRAATFGTDSGDDDDSDSVIDWDDI